jgi:class 3 adenylate cyclase
MFKGSLNVVQQLASVFNKFDEICEQRQVYKVHSFGDFYVLMSYNGKLPKEKRRNQDLQIEEAYNIILAGFDMLTVVEELQNMGNMIIRNSNLKIGIHTGKIVGALIGQNFVRYDIFGSDVKLT